MFEKKTWEDRITENPGRRKLTNTETGEETTVDVERAEGNVSRVGTSFSSVNMNDLENRIYSMFPCKISDGGTGATTASKARENLDVMHGVWLYDNESGSASTIKLSKTSRLYDFLEIYYIDDDNYYFCVKAISPSGRYFPLTSISYSSNETMMYIKSDVIRITGDTIERFASKGGWMYSNNSSTKVAQTTKLKITQVIGYSY